MLIRKKKNEFHDLFTHIVVPDLLCEGHNNKQTYKSL